METVRNVYYNMTTERLLRLKSEKLLALQKIEGAHMTYFSQQEARKLRQQYNWICAVLLSRRDQQSLF